MRFDIYRRGQRDRLACKAGQPVEQLTGIGEGWVGEHSGVGNIHFANVSKSARQIEDDVTKHGRSLYSLNRVARPVS